MVVASTRVFFKPPTLLLIGIIVSMLLLLLFMTADLVVILSIPVIYLIHTVSLREQRLVAIRSNLVAFGICTGILLLTISITGFLAVKSPYILYIIGIAAGFAYFTLRMLSGKGMVFSVLIFLPFIMVSPVSMPIVFITSFMCFELFFLAMNLVYLNVVGARATDLFSAFFSYWYDDERSRVSVVLGKIRRESEISNRLAVFDLSGKRLSIVVPGVHFGPLGEVGSADLPALVEDKAGDNEVFVVAHSPSTHDLDMVDRAQAQDLASQLVKRARNLSSFNELSFRYASSSEKSATCHVLDFAEFSFVCFSNSPETTEDILSDFGNSVLQEASRSLPNPMVIDCHDSDTGEILQVSSVNSQGNSYMKAFRKALKEIQKHKRSSISMGVVHLSGREIHIPHIGSNGINVVMVESEKNICLVFIDANSISSSLRVEMGSRIEEHLLKHRKKKYSVIIFTSDTHEINMKRGIMNPLEDHGVVEVICTQIDSVSLSPSRAGSVEFDYPAYVIANSREYSGLFAASLGFMVAFAGAALVLAVAILVAGLQ